MIPYINTVVWLIILAAAVTTHRVLHPKKPRPGKRKLSTVLKASDRFRNYLMVVFFVAVVMRASTAGIISITSDEGFFIYSAKRVHEGLQPYRDFILTQQPLYMYVTAAVFKISGVGVLQAKIIPVAASVLTVLLAYYTAERIWGWEHALASAFVIGLSPYVIKFTNAATAYPEMLALNLASAVLFMEGVKGGDGRYLLASGFLAGLAGLYKMLGLVVLAPALVYLFLKDRGNLIEYGVVTVLGALLVLVPATMLLWSPEYVYQVYLHHGLYEDAGLSCKLGEFVKVLAVDPIFMVPGLVGAYVALRRRNRKPEEDYLLLYLACTIPLVFILKYLCGFAHPYLYFTLSIPPLALLSGAAFTGARENALPVLVSLLLVTAFGYYVFLMAESFNHGLINAVAAYVEENTSPGDQIMGMSYLACPVAFKTDRDIPPEFMEFFHLRIGVEGYSDDHYREGTEDVKYAIMYDTSQYPEFMRFLRENAAVEESYGNLKPIRIYRIGLG